MIRNRILFHIKGEEKVIEKNEVLQITVAVQGWRNFTCYEFSEGINAWTMLEQTGHVYTPEHYVYINGKREGGEKVVHDGDSIAYLKSTAQ